MAHSDRAAARDKVIPAGEHCNARNRSGSYCELPAGWGTDHVGEGRCKLHGGASPVRHGLYSKVTKHRLADRIAEVREREDLLELREQVAVQVSVVQEYLAGLAEGEFTADDAKTVSKLVDEVSRNIERLKKLEKDEELVFEATEIQVVLARVVTVVRQVAGAEAAHAVGERLLSPSQSDDES